MRRHAATPLALAAGLVTASLALPGRADAQAPRGAAPPPLAAMSLGDVGRLARDRFTEQPAVSCPAAFEFMRRNPDRATNTQVGGVEVVVRYCTKLGYTAAGTTPAPAPAPRAVAADPPLGRYVCLALGNTPTTDGAAADPVYGRTATARVENRLAPDLTLRAGSRYAAMGASGRYTFDRRTRTLTWVDGPLATARTDWVGVFVPAGQGAKDPTLVVRSRRDIADGNKRELQWCNHAG
jgi:hypothetical protein